MFTTFTGNSRRPRNVNLSGRTTNPFAATASHSPSAVAQAQQERQARQLQRERTTAAKTLQRYWRGRASRRRSRSIWREQWDKEIQEAGLSIDWKDQPPHKQPTTDDKEVEDNALRWARLLAAFARWDEGDVPRVSCLAQWLELQGILKSPSRTLDKVWERPLLGIARVALDAIKHENELRGDGDTFNFSVDIWIRELLGLLVGVSDTFPDSVARLGLKYYTELGHMVARHHDAWISDAACRAMIRPLQGAQRATNGVYVNAILGLLTTPDLQLHLDFAKLAKALDFPVLAKTVRQLLKVGNDHNMLKKFSRISLIWLLAYFIHIHGYAQSSHVSKIDAIASISSLLSYLSEDLGQRPDMHNSQDKVEIPRFVDAQVTGLINEESITGLLANTDFIPSTNLNEPSSAGTRDAAVLASYALTLLQVFPRRRDDIHFWLYMGSTSAIQGQESREPAIKFFWKAVHHTEIYREIYRDASRTVKMLRYDRQKDLSQDQRLVIEQQWRVIFLFLELYSFVLRIMDDDEFMAGGQNTTGSQSWTRRSALELSQVQDLTVFLKNFAFAMYWYSSQIMGTDQQLPTQSLASYFGHEDHETQFKEEIEQSNKSDEVLFPGINGMTVAYMKGMVTGLLRMLYERDSRRHFCPEGHWLMKDFEMKGFIQAVVAEQAYRNEHQGQPHEEDGAEEAMDDENELEDSRPLVGTSHTQQILRNERLKQQQQRAIRQKRLENLTPRLEILQNMPFFIPFATRVEIFRQFVLDDQIHRRNGFVDPDQWRMFGGLSSFLPGRNGQNSRLEQLSKHSAKVRRDHVFEDAFQQFYELGEGLKEPIQITFVDQFDTVEAGIDGGGVTKEFLTSVTTEAFTPNQELNLFVENDQHLLFPNPSAIDELRESLKEKFAFREGSPEYNNAIRDLLRRYEFLGRIIGKCLYEGILVDIHFAPFFLVKWALTGGSGSATNESGYYANINDLRDLDEELYQGLLKLKNYPGNVEDFGLDFTITDIVARPSQGKGNKTFRTVSRPLRAGGAHIPVTNANRIIYIAAVARHRLQLQPAAQTSAFLKGLSRMIQPSWLSMFNQSELQTLLGGAASAEIDVEDLRRNTIYSGVYEIGDDGQEHPTVKLFWEVLRECGDSDRRAVLKYVTSTPRAPLLGFGTLNPRFTIRDSGSDEGRLPSTSTCVNLLKLPIYKSKRVLKEKLLYAVHSGAGFNLS